MYGNVFNKAFQMLEHEKQLSLYTISNVMSLLHWAINESVFKSRNKGSNRNDVRILKVKSDQDRYKRKLFQIIGGMQPSLGDNQLDFMVSSQHNPHADHMSLQILNNAAQLCSADDRWKRTRLTKVLEQLLYEMDADELFQTGDSFKLDFPRFVWAIGQLGLVDYM